MTSLTRPTTLIEALDSADPSAPFVTMWTADEPARATSFGEFRSKSQLYASALARLGARRGTTVILIVRQGVDLMVCFAAAMRAGAVPAILAYPHRKLEPQKYRAGLRGVSANLRPAIVVLDDDFPHELRATLDVAQATVVHVGDLAAQASAEVDAAARPDDVAFIQHSAGTTGLQKGVALSHAAVLRQVEALADTLRLAADDRIYSWLPLYHDMGLIACFMLPLARAIPVVMQDPLEWVIQPASMLRAMTETRSTLAWLPNFAFQFLARRVTDDERDGVQLAHVRALISCSEPVRAASLDEFLTAFEPLGLRREAIHSSYAMAETVFAVTQSPVTGDDVGPRRVWVDGRRLRDEHRAVPVAPEAPGATCLVSSGRLLQGVEIRILSDEGQAVEDGVLGEVLVHAPWLFDGYYNRPDLTANAMRGGWYASGDLGFLLDGELYVLARKKDLIIVGGRNIYPEDVEAIAMADPRVHDGRAVALGFYNPDTGTEDIVIVAEAESMTHLTGRSSIEQDVRRAVNIELAVPVRAVCITEPGWIVKSSAGKPARSDTRAKLMASYPELLPGGAGNE